MKCKYIDAEKLIAEIERLKEETPIGICEYDKGEENGRMEVLTSLQSTLTSLQQEQPEVNIWHDVNKEAPTNFGDDIIVLCKNKNKEDGIWLADLIQFDGQYEPRVNWEDPVKWAYLSEILPQRD